MCGTALPYRALSAYVCAMHSPVLTHCMPLSPYARVSQGLVLTCRILLSGVPRLGKHPYWPTRLLRNVRAYGARYRAAGTYGMQHYSLDTGNSSTCWLLCYAMRGTETAYGAMRFADSVARCTTRGTEKAKCYQMLGDVRYWRSIDLVVGRHIERDPEQRPTRVLCAVLRSCMAYARAMRSPALTLRMVLLPVGAAVNARYGGTKVGLGGTTRLLQEYGVSEHREDIQRISTEATQEVSEQFVPARRFIVIDFALYNDVQPAAKSETKTQQSPYTLYQQRGNAQYPNRLLLSRYKTSSTDTSGLRYYLPSTRLVVLTLVYHATINQVQDQWRDAEFTLNNFKVPISLRPPYAMSPIPLRPPYALSPISLRHPYAMSPIYLRPPYAMPGAVREPVVVSPMPSPVLTNCILPSPYARTTRTPVLT
eukprot:3940662-Rhodomonas_salina.5